MSITPVLLLGRLHGKAPKIAFQGEYKILVHAVQRLCIPPAIEAVSVFDEPYFAYAGWLAVHPKASLFTLL